MTVWSSPKCRSATTVSLAIEGVIVKAEVITGMHRRRETVIAVVDSDFISTPLFIFPLDGYSIQSR